MIINSEEVKDKIRDITKKWDSSGHTSIIKS